MFFVSGVTGKVGGAAARQLLEDGHTLRTLARDPLKASEWSQQGVHVRRGDFNDTAAVAGALEGVAGAYLMLPRFFAPGTGFPEAKAIIASFREALRPGASAATGAAILDRIAAEQQPRAYYHNPPA